jgi:hypothetical protein
MEQLTKILSQFELVDRIITQKDLDNLAIPGKKIPIIMGQTFDDGQPVDMVKYGLVIMEIEEALKNTSADPSSQWVLADHFMTAINKEKELSESLNQRSLRQKFLEKINSVYHGKINVVYSSDLAHQEGYKWILKQLQKDLEKNTKFREQIFSSIPEDRRKNPEALRYPLEELATIFSLDTQIKVGPRYEIKYDLPARAAAIELGFPKYVAIHLTNSLPLGNPQISKEAQSEIDLFGLTPYKISSKKLRDYRLDPINGIQTKEQNLIMQTQDFGAIKDLIALSLLARKRLTGKVYPRFTENLNDFQHAKEIAYDLYLEYIKRPLTE